MPFVRVHLAHLRYLAQRPVGHLGGGQAGVRPAGSGLQGPDDDCAALGGHLHADGRRRARRAEQLAGDELRAELAAEALRLLVLCVCVPAVARASWRVRIEKWMSV